MDVGKPRLFSAPSSLRYAVANLEGFGWLEMLLSLEGCQGGHQEPGVAALCRGELDWPLARTVIFRMGMWAGKNPANWGGKVC